MALTRQLAGLLWLCTAAALTPLTDIRAQEARGAVSFAVPAAPGQPGRNVRLYSKSYALVIGIDNYENETSWRRLGKAVSDAEEIAKILRVHGFEVDLQPNLKSRDLKEKLEEFLTGKGADPEARLLVWFAGHGHIIDGRGYLVPSDAPPASTPEFRRKALSMSNYVAWLEEAQSKHILSIFDSCFSGAALSIATTRNNDDMAAPAELSIDTANKARQLITSGDEKEQVNDDGEFRDLFIAAITGNAANLGADGFVTGTDLGRYLRREMIRRTHGIKTYKQTPNHGPLVRSAVQPGDFVFEVVRPDGSKPDIKVKADKFVPGLAAGWTAMNEHDLRVARRHFEPLAKAGTIEAMRAMARIAREQQQHEAMLDWTKMAADKGDAQAAYDLLDAASKNWLRNLPRRWTDWIDDKAARRAEMQAMFKSGRMDAALLLDAMAEPETTTPELVEAARRGFIPAEVVQAKAALVNAPGADQMKPSDHQTVAGAIRTLERAATSGFIGAMAKLVDSDIGDYRKALALPEPPAVIAAIVEAAEADLKRHESASLALFEDVHRVGTQMMALAVERLLDGNGVKQDAARAVVLSGALVDRMRRDSPDKDDNEEFDRARARHAAALRANGRNDEAWSVLLDINGATALPDIVAMAAARGWKDDSERLVATLFKKHCAKDAIVLKSSDPLDLTECAATALALAERGTPILRAAVAAALPAWLTTDDGKPIDPGREKGLILYLQARVGADGASLSADTVRQLMRQSAELEDPRAIAWLRTNNQPVPTSLLDNIPKRDTDFFLDWRGDVEKTRQSTVSCSAYTENGIFAKLGGLERKPSFGLGGGQPNWSLEPRFLHGVTALDPASVKMFIDRDEVAAKFVPTGKDPAKQLRIEVSDMAAIVRRLSSGTMVRFEYRAGARLGNDAFTLRGSTDAYNALVTACPRLKPVAVAAGPGIAVPPTKGATPIAQPKGATPAVAAAPVAKMQWSKDQYYKGDGKKVAVTTEVACAAACEEQAACKAVEFIVKKRECRLYEVVEQSFPASGTNVAVKRTPAK